MSVELGNLDLTNVEASDDMSPMPNGEYVAMMVDSEISPTRSGDGQYIKATFQIVEGDFKNRYVWHNFNLWNPSAKASQIAKGQLMTVAMAVGLPAVPATTNDLHNRPMMVKIAYVPENNGYKAKNEIKHWKKIHGSVAAHQPAPAQGPIGQQMPQQAQPENAAPQAAKPVWAQKRP